MPDVKPTVEPEQVQALLCAYFGQPVVQLAPLSGGQIARTFSFSAGGQDYVIRFNTSHMLANFEKEAYLHRRYSSDRLCMPCIVHVGRLQDFWFAISHKVPGRPLDRLSVAEYERALPSLVKTLDAIHHLDVSDTRNYGLFDDRGTGFFPSWRAYLANIREEEEEWDFHGKWHVLFDTSFLERHIFDLVYDHMLHLLDYCPEDRYLVHGEYGYGNVVVHDGRVSGVLDWIDAKYGDFVYDVAWLDFWPAGHDFQELFRQYYASCGVVVPHYKERILCYKCYMALDALRFFAKVGNLDAYQSTRRLILDRLAAYGFKEL